MRPRMLIATALAVVTVGALAAPARAQEGYSHGRLRYVEPGVTVQRATEVESEEAAANAPFLPGDRIWTDANGRAEFQFPDGTVVRLERRSKLDYSGHEQENGERVVLRLWSGSLMLHVRSQGGERFEVETPAGLVQGQGRSVVRVDVDGGETSVSVYEGEAVLDDGGERPRLAAGERTSARWGEQAAEPTRLERGAADDFLRWDQDRETEERERRPADSARYLPDELDPYAGEFEDNGSWGYESGVGNVWIPRVEAGWQPYSNGQWTWTPYGWTWIPNERWGWAPFHYGRWGQSASFGWYWIPGRTWGPAWVSWAVGGGYVGWCPLGWRDRPVYGWGRHDYGRYSGNATARGGRGFGHDGWNLVRQGELGRRDLPRRRIGLDRVDTSVLQVAESPRLRPTRDAAHLREGEDVPRAISRRPSMGDHVRELGVDNKTSIPAPWTRGYGPPPAGVDGARYGAQGRERGGDQGEAGQSQHGTATGASPRQGARPAPWYTPPADPGTPTEGGVRTGDDGARRRAPRVDSGSGGDSEKTTNGGRAGRQGGAWRAPESGSGGSGSGGGGTAYRPRHEGSSGGNSGGGSGRPSGGSGHSGGSGNSGGSGRSGRSSGGSSSGSHATHRDRN